MWGICKELPWPPSSTHVVRVLVCGCAHCVPMKCL